MFSNLPGWRTKRKIVVFESDDWGSIRMPSLKAYRHLKAEGVSVDRGDNFRFNTLDTLASVTDFEELFGTLNSSKDSLGNSPAFTAMSLSANPDFDKIRLDNFTNYHYKTIWETLHDYDQQDAIPLWKEGFEQRLFVPEFHGREHLNVRLWLKALQEGDNKTVEAFNFGCWGFKSEFSEVSYQAAFHVGTIKDLSLHQEIITDGIRLFESIHHRKPNFFVPPNGAISQVAIEAAVKSGISYISSPKILNEPTINGKRQKRFRYLGKIGMNGQIFMTRNCFFEPSYLGKGYQLEDCLGHIDAAFKCYKPAVISTHRVNYIGGLNEKNRKEGNVALKSLLKQMLARWPDIEFMTSTQLGQLIRNDKK